MAGDKSGGSEKRFYRELIGKANRRFDAHLAWLRKERAMSVNIRDQIKRSNRVQRKKVDYPGAELVAEEMNLRDLRKVSKFTQTRAAKTLGITQDSVSRFENRSDLLISMGGDVRIIAEFPDRAPVVQSELSEDDPPRESSRRHAHAQTLERVHDTTENSKSECILIELGC